MLCMSRSIQDLYLIKIGRPRNPKVIGLLIKEIGLKGFTIYGRGGHFGNVTRTI